MTSGQYSFLAERATLWQRPTWSFWKNYFTTIRTPRRRWSCGFVTSWSTLSARYTVGTLTWVRRINEVVEKSTGFWFRKFKKFTSFIIFPCHSRLNVLSISLSFDFGHGISYPKQQNNQKSSYWSTQTLDQYQFCLWFLVKLILRILITIQLM